MKYFLDTEFIEQPGFMQLISIGIVAEDGRTFYAENMSFDEREASEWVRENVLSKLRWWTKRGGCSQAFWRMDKLGSREEKTEVFGTITAIKDVLLRFFNRDDNFEFWGYYSDYDWVNFSWIFGRMIDLPRGFPKYCRDLKQLLDESGKEKIPDPTNEHNALADALWNKRLYEYLTGGLNDETG